MHLTQDHKDVLDEMVNVGVGRAAASLNAMVGYPVDLQVPYVDVVPSSDIGSALELPNSENLNAIEQQFDGSFKGLASIIFPHDSAKNIVALLLGEEDTSLCDFDAECEATLSEVGNILINGILGSMGNMTDQTIHYRVPVVHQAFANDMCQRWQETGPNVMLAKVSFSVSDKAVNGNFLLIFEMSSEHNIRTVLDKLLAG